MDVTRRVVGRSRRSSRSHRPGVEALDARQLLSGFAAPAGDHLAFLAHAEQQVVSDVSSTIDREHRFAAGAASATPPQLTGDHAPSAAVGAGRVISGITYTAPGMAPEHLDLYLPAGTPPPGGWPIILAFPGGGWRWASRQQYGEQVAVLTKAGFAVAGVDYAYASNTPNGSHSWPVPLEDAQQAVRWVREHAAGLHLNPDEIVAMGDSAGANLALLLATYPQGPVLTDAPPSGPTPDDGQVSDAVQAVVDFYGPTDLTALYDESRPAVLPYFDTYLGGPPSEFPGRYAAASPITYVNSGTPPVLIVQGMEDVTNLPSQSLELDSALTKAGVPHQLITISWATHGFGLNLVGDNFPADIANFVDEAFRHEPIPETVASP
jgi:acetyl esterase/lipase